jgi:hypothetical protein
MRSSLPRLKTAAYRVFSPSRPLQHVNRVNSEQLRPEFPVLVTLAGQTFRAVGLAAENLPFACMTWHAAWVSPIRDPAATRNPWTKYAVCSFVNWSRHLQHVNRVNSESRGETGTLDLESRPGKRWGT